MTGRVALVTGAGSGIGRASARKFASNGAKVVVTDLSAKSAAETVALITEDGGTAIAYQLDVSDHDQVEAAVAFAVETYGSLDFAHNNAGMSGRPYLLENVPLEAWNQVVSVNLNGIFYCLKYELAQMNKQGHGAIVNTASTAGLGGTPLMGAYSATKHGVVGLTKTAAIDYAAKGIRVNVMAPGTTATPMLDALIGTSEEQKASFESSSPMNRLGTVDELGAAAVWLCSDEAGYITGQALAVDGGLSAMMGAGSGEEG
ncbi:SDR family NAD(P)-dependent oxidoreductase [Frondihabitans cladoniiphilus]